MTDSTKKRVLAIGIPQFATASIEKLREKYIFDFIIPDPTSRMETIRKIHKAAEKNKYDACFWLFRNAPISPFTKEMLGPLVPGCRLFITGASGYDDLDVEWMTANGAYVSNVPNASTEGTAVMNLLLFLSVLRGSREAEQTMRSGKWHGNLPLMEDPCGKTVGIIGMGAIGKSFAQKIIPLGCKVIYNNRNRLSTEEETTLDIKYATLDELLSTSDVISINCPLTPSTKNLLSKKEFQKMKDDVYILNTARGSIIDEEAFIEAIQSGKVCRAGLDVFVNEPNPNPFWLTSDKVTVQPHWGGFTTSTVAMVEEAILRNIDTFFETGCPLSYVNNPLIRG
ncbi:glyoxylate reductase [Schizosaccharomyces cryophilus OY26]|uniref:Glyoxylate reductase n=1 Tax=Schizosaccharomyces cryophilus (strain OY26 / ATCC MYA-4695 / CBS 11777 / NBRC 106824 / NRRL Y48691) TaxID=653667 RepID=S9VNF4_SCHCR|nr:glyoxylate reductase [Schizosaccharomyces cryophilus OY26]EPY49478.1 glyoxylate reductase [Schizosaccharomyces cryophilus OY26]